MVGGALQDSVRYFCAFVFVFVFEELVFVSPSPLLSFSLSPVFSDGWWCIAGVSQAESLLQTEPNLTFTAGRSCQPLKKVSSRKFSQESLLQTEPNLTFTAGSCQPLQKVFEPNLTFTLLYLRQFLQKGDLAFTL